MTLKQLPVLIAVSLLVGCGGDKRITAEDKDELRSAALTISRECIVGDADVSTVEDAVTSLLDARDEFGDQRFTLSDELANVTVQDIIDRQAELMELEECAQEQRERLQD